MNGDKKQNLFIALGIVAIIVCIFIFIKLNNDSKNAFVVVNDNVLGYVDKKWYNVKNNSIIFDDYKFELYNNNNRQGEFELRYFNSSWYYFDTNRDSHKFDGNIIALAGDRKISLESIEKQAITDSDLNNINKALKNNNIIISDIDELSQFEKIEFDFNDDNIKETVYSINNINSDYNSDNYFTAVIYSINNKNNLLIFNNESAENKDDLYLYSLDYVVNVNNEANLIMTAAKNLDVTSTNNTIYKYNNKIKSLDAVKDLDKNYVTVEAKDKDNYGLTIVIIIVAVLFVGALVYVIVKQKRKEQNKI